MARHGWRLDPSCGASPGAFDEEPAPRRHLSSLGVVTIDSLTTSPTIAPRHQAAPGARLSCLICRAWLLIRGPSRRGQPEAGAAPLTPIALLLRLWRPLAWPGIWHRHRPPALPILRVQLRELRITDHQQVFAISRLRRSREIE